MVKSLSNRLGGDQTEAAGPAGHSPHQEYFQIKKRRHSFQSFMVSEVMYPHGPNILKTPTINVGFTGV
jgi:hypothetical protein